MTATLSLAIDASQLAVDVSQLAVGAPPVDTSHRELLDGPFWTHIPAYAGVSEREFFDGSWQAKNTITSSAKLLAALGDRISPKLAADVQEGLARAPMSIRVTPYILSLIDWDRPYDDPLRVQFVPLASALVPDHPQLDLDSLHEQADSPVPGLTHRYHDKALFLALDTCPVYCRFCTRSYAVGVDTEAVEKVSLKVSNERWARAFAYVAVHPSIEDIVVSGGDAYQLRAAQIEEIGEALLAIPNVRRIRFATKGLAVMPQKVLSDAAWVDALTRIVDKGRRLRKQVAVHTHFNHPREITAITAQAMDVLVERGIIVRNQCVLQRGVNATPETMSLLVKRLSWINVQPYYVYVHDLVRGVEDLRTSVDRALALEKHVRGSTAGFNTPMFVVDLPGGGGKRDAHSYEHYDRETGISVYTAPAVKPGRLFTYFDPLRDLSLDAQRRWADPRERDGMIRAALTAARG
ncbi:MAG TPA: KamA family radical SAM protein [Labilithrix sp.]|nr:KamA family radical SAM protein [Labilithrix sp.]